jgi:hypothetical protein
MASTKRRHAIGCHEKGVGARSNRGGNGARYARRGWEIEGSDSIAMRRA